ncbi:MAG: class I SAM-dependent methyltransferase, partial [Planctomycetes bacterium]|nr:class I SAM-dependent methyltransferase [Planctomycetota bacterium]
GCGYGMTLGYLNDTYGTRGIGLDYDHKVLNRARQRVNKHLHLPLIQAGLSSIPVRADHFNGVFCECVLSLVQDRAACLAELYRILARNGQLVITDLYIRKWRANPDSVSPETSPPSCLTGAVTLFEMMTAIEHAGFQIDIIEDHTSLLSQLGTPQVSSEKMGYCMIIAGKYSH